MRTKAELRGEILAAARAEFARCGLAGARIDRIAKAAAASKERLYAHFSDKETLFREVVATDFAEFMRAVTLRPTAVAEFAGDIYDLTCSRPEHFRMLAWAQLEGFALVSPESEVELESAQAQGFGAIAAAQADGLVDPAWQPADLMALLFSIGLTWVNLPGPAARTDDPDVIAHRRAVAVDAATRLVARRP